MHAFIYELFDFESMKNRHTQAYIKERAIWFEFKGFSKGENFER